MTQVISAHEASVATVSVSVRTLVIGNRQMTKSILNQLIQDNSFFDKEGKLRGEIWGWVNIHNPRNRYNPNGCWPTDGHIHVVWQVDDELRIGVTAPHYESSIIYPIAMARGQLFVAS